MEKLEIDWSKVPEHYSYVAVDYSARVYAYKVYPHFGKTMAAWTWNKEGGYEHHMLHDSEQQWAVSLEAPVLDWYKHVYKRPVEKFHILTGHGGIVPSKRHKRYATEYVNQGNYFASKEEAEKERDRRALMVELRAFKGAEKFVKGEVQYTVYQFAGKIKYTAGISAQHPNTIQFHTEEDIEAAIKHFGDRLNLLFDS